MLWAITCVDRPESAGARDAHMQAHRVYLDRQKSILVLGGATLSDDGMTATGSLFIVNVSGRADAERFSQNDPFTQAGVFAPIAITRIRKSQWNPAAASDA